MMFLARALNNILILQAKNAMHCNNIAIGSAPQVVKRTKKLVTKEWEMWHKKTCDVKNEILMR